MFKPMENVKTFF